MTLAITLVDTGSLLGALGPFLLVVIFAVAAWRSGTHRATRELAESRERLAEAAKEERDRERERTKHALEEARALRRVNETLAKRTDLGPLLEQNREFQQQFMVLLRDIQSESHRTRAELTAHMEKTAETLDALTRALDAIADSLKP